MLDAATSILASQGWIPLPELTPNHRIAQFSPEDASLVAFEPPLAITAHEYDGCLLSIDDFLVSHDQMLYVSLSHHPERRYKPVFGLYPANAQRRYSRKSVWQAAFRVRRAGSGTNLPEMPIEPFERLSTVEFARLTGFFLGDGYSTRRSTHKLWFQLTRLRKSNYLADICNHPQMRLPMGIRKSQYYTIRYPAFGKWFSENCYVPHSSIKTIPPLFLENSQEVLLALLDGLRHSDGYSYNAERWMYSTTSPSLADFVQAVGVVAGVPFSCHLDNGCYRMSALIRDHSPHVNDVRVRRFVEEVPYAGTVYDVQTRTGLIAIRRNANTMLIGG